MSASIKSKILRAGDHLETASKFTSIDNDHMEIGYNLAQAVEKFLQALCEMHSLNYSEAEDFDALFELLEENEFSSISSFADLIDLYQYNDSKSHVRKEDRLDLTESLQQINELKKMVGETFREMF